MGETNLQDREAWPISFKFNPSHARFPGTTFPLAILWVTPLSTSLELRALSRPGRLDRIVRVELPDRSGREAILRVHTRKTPLEHDADLGKIAQLTPGMSGADLAGLVNEAAIRAVRRSSPMVGQVDLDLAVKDFFRSRGRWRHQKEFLSFILPSRGPWNRMSSPAQGRRPWLVNMGFGPLFPLIYCIFPPFLSSSEIGTEAEKSWKRLVGNVMG